MPIEPLTSQETGGIIGPDDLPIIDRINELIDRVNALDTLIPEGAPAKFTPEGGLAVQLTNKTGAASVKGTLVEADDTTDNAFKVMVADDPDPIGAVYEDGIADGEPCWVVVAGIAEVLIEDGTAATRSYWAKVSDTVAGRADITNPAPAGGAIAALEDHFTEIGHCLETKGSGTDVLAKIVMHFN